MAVSLVLVLGGVLTQSGCDGGGGEDGAIVKPPEPPAVSAKDSMNEYLKSHKKAKMSGINN